MEERRSKLRVSQVETIVSSTEQLTKLESVLEAEFPEEMQDDKETSGDVAIRLLRAYKRKLMEG